MLFKVHKTRHDNAFAKTHVGQAHLAGTGPDRKSCRECAHWGTKQRGEVVAPQYKADGTLKLGGCHYEIPGKSKRAFPHTAKACRFFEQNNAPPRATDPEKL